MFCKWIIWFVPPPTPTSLWNLHTCKAEPCGHWHLILCTEKPVWRLWYMKWWRMLALILLRYYKLGTHNYTAVFFFCASAIFSTFTTGVCVCLHKLFSIIQDVIVNFVPLKSIFTREDDRCFWIKQVTFIWLRLRLFKQRNRQTRIKQIAYTFV